RRRREGDQRSVAQILVRRVADVAAGGGDEVGRQGFLGLLVEQPLRSGATAGQGGQGGFLQFGPGALGQHEGSQRFQRRRLSRVGRGGGGFGEEVGDGGGQFRAAVEVAPLGRQE